MENVGSAAVTATFNEIENADVAIVIGANPVENHPVAATYFKQFAKRGGKLIVMDPRGQGLQPPRHPHAAVPPRHRRGAAERDHERDRDGGPPRPAVRRGFTEGFEQFAEHIRGFEPERMAPLCGIAPEVIRDVARTFAGARAAMIFWGMGISQHIHGTDNSRCLISLALLCGQVGRPGTGLHPLRGQNNVQGASDAGLIPMVMPDYQPVGAEAVRELFRQLWQGTEIAPEPGLTVVEIIDAIARGADPRHVYSRREPGDVRPGRGARPGGAGRSSSTWWCRTCS